MNRKIQLSIFVTLVAIGVAEADSPQPVVMQTHVVFYSQPIITFTAIAPLCTSGTGVELRRLANPSPAHGWTVDVEYTCDDNSGTFRVKYHPQFGAIYAGGTGDSEFTVAGPWSIVAGGTGQYAKLRGHGDFGVIIDFSTDPWTGEESFVGFVQLK